MIKHEDYKKTIFEKKQKGHKIKTIQSKSHQLKCYIINKISLSCFDANCYILEKGIKTLADGLKNIK